MFKLLANAFLGAGLLVTGAAIVPAQVARAQGLELQIGPDGVTPRFRGDDEERDYRRRHRYDEMRHRGCDPEDARDAARDYGLRHPRIMRITPRSVVVEGMTRDGPERMRFRNVPGCPAYR